jgi:Stage II sporulation protein E (SpoIIE)
VASAAAMRQSTQLPAFVPLLEELEVAGWSSHRRMLSGNFHDWSLLEGRKLLVVVGQAVTSGLHETADPVEAALVAQAVWAAIRSHAQHTNDAGALLSLAARGLWPNATPKMQAAVALALVDLEGGQANVAVAGDCLALRIRATGGERVAAEQPLLGINSGCMYLGHSVQLSLRERILLVADEPQQRPAKLATRVVANFSKLDAESHRRMTAADVVAIVRQEYEQAATLPLRPSASIVALRRR